MKSIKPGRGPSMMGAFGSAAVTIFGVIWTVSTMSMGAPGFFTLFGILFVIVGIGQTAYNFINATGKNRFSEFDITDEKEEPDPLNDIFSGKVFCPYCGTEAEKDFLYCAKCGKQLPQD